MQHKRKPVEHVYVCACAYTHTCATSFLLYFIKSLFLQNVVVIKDIFFKKNLCVTEANLIQILDIAGAILFLRLLTLVKLTAI